MFVLLVEGVHSSFHGNAARNDLLQEAKDGLLKLQITNLPLNAPSSNFIWRNTVRIIR